MKILEDMSGNKIYFVESTKDWETVPEDVIDLNIGKKVSLSKDFFDKFFPLLKSITVEDGNVKLSSSNGVLYDYYKNKIYLYPPQKKDKTFIIPEGVKDIYRDCFRENSYLTQVTLPKSLSYVGYYAFKGVNLLRVNISDLNSFCQISFSTSMFNKNTLLYVDGKKVNDELVIEDVNYIKPHTFDNLQLDEVTLKDVHIIGDEAFYNCGIRYLYVESKELRILKNAFFKNPLMQFYSYVEDFAFANSFDKLEIFSLPKESLIQVGEIENFKCRLFVRRNQALDRDVYSLPEVNKDILMEIYGKG